MKNIISKTAIIFLLSLFFLALVSYYLIETYVAEQKIGEYHLVKDILLILTGILVYSYIATKKRESTINILMELQKTNNELHDSNERYDIVAKATSDTIWDWKIQENLFLWNNGIQSVFGYKPDEIEYTSDWWFDRIHKEDSLRVSVKLYSFLEQKTEKWQDEYRFKCADGHYKYVFDRGFLVKDENGKAIRMIGAIQDISKQKEEEERLKLLETVITQTKDGVVITGTDTTTTPIPKMIFCNEAFCKMTGYDQKEILQQSPIFLMSKNTHTDELNQLILSVIEKKPCSIEAKFVKKNGEEFWVDFSMIPVTDKEGKYSHWISLQRDITESKNQEREKEQLIRELTQNNKDLKQFSYITSHNFRAPISNLTGLLNLIDDIEITDPELKEIIAGFRKSTNLLNETIDDLIKVVVIKDNPSIYREEVNIKNLTENIIFQLNHLTKHSHPVFHLEVPKNLCLHINKSYLESIVLNLLTNAIKYCSNERPLSIIIKAWSEGKSTLLSIEDNGIGIDLTKNKGKIFGLYQRFHNYSDSKGLGLYLVKSQVEAMGGSIEVESFVNKGTKFTIIFTKTESHV